MELNVVCFDYPYPPNYGGIIDVFFKVKKLNKLGVSIVLHVFTDRVDVDHPQLKEVSSQIFYYDINKKWYYFFYNKPFSVLTRNHKDLLQNLKLNNSPILFEGLKSTYCCQDEQLDGRVKLLRYHNIEHDYYNGISKSESNLLKKKIYSLEASKYKKYENILPKFDKVFTLSIFETNHVDLKFGNAKYIPAFHGNKQLQELSEYGEYVLYHGDLSISDNIKSVLFLIDAFKRIQTIKFVIASGSNEALITKKIKGYNHIKFEKIKDFNHLKQLFKKSHVCVSWSFQQSGTKLKLINALFNSRFNVVNKNVVDDVSILSICNVVNTKAELVNKVLELMTKPYNDIIINSKQIVLNSKLSDSNNAKVIKECVKDLVEKN